MRHTKKVAPDVMTLKSASMTYTLDPIYDEPLEPLDIVWKKQTIPISIEMQTDHQNFSYLVNKAMFDSYAKVEENLKQNMIFPLKDYKND